MNEKNSLDFIFRYDLQLFAKDGPDGEKTEEPTAKKLTDARKKVRLERVRKLRQQPCC